MGNIYLLLVPWNLYHVLILHIVIFPSMHWEIITFLQQPLVVNQIHITGFFFPSIIFS